MNKSKKICKNCMILGVVLLLVIYLIMPSYYIHTSVVHTSNNHTIREVKLYVIVHKRFYNENLYREIEENYNTYSTQPTELELKLYYSKWHFSKNKSYKTVVFKYADN